MECKIKSEIAEKNEQKSHSTFTALMPPTYFVYTLFWSIFHLIYNGRTSDDEFICTYSSILRVEFNAFLLFEERDTEKQQRNERSAFVAINHAAKSIRAISILFLVEYEWHMCEAAGAKRNVKMLRGFLYAKFCLANHLAECVCCECMSLF